MVADTGGGGGHDVKLRPEQIQKLADLLEQEVCSELDAAKAAIGKSSPQFYNWGGNFAAMTAAHTEIKSVTTENITSFSDKTVKQQFGNALHITAQNWKHAEDKSKVKGAK